jgi:hypothetical protein
VAMVMKVMGHTGVRNYQHPILDPVREAIDQRNSRHNPRHSEMRGSENKLQVIEKLEPTSGLEPLTCRLRIDPVLRMLLCDKVYSRAFWGVFEHSGDHLYSTWYSRMTSRFQIGRLGHCQPGTAVSRYFRKSQRTGNKGSEHQSCRSPVNIPVYCSLNLVAAVDSNRMAR